MIVIALVPHQRLLAKVAQQLTQQLLIKQRNQLIIQSITRLLQPTKRQLTTIIRNQQVIQTLRRKVPHQVVISAITMVM